MDSYWNGKVVFISGASSGIGRGIALNIARHGALLGLLARREDLLNALVKDIEALGGKAVALPADVTSYESVCNSISRVTEEFGPIDAVIANAGVGATGDARKLDAKEFAKVININLIGAVNCIAPVIPEMLARGSGQLVAISSLAAYRGLPKSAAYSASKAALSALFESIRVDLRGTGVDVTIIHPGFIKTALTAGRKKRMPYLMELDAAVDKIVRAIEKRKRSVAFPWQLATVVRGAMLMPAPLYDRIVSKRSYRE